MEPEEFSMITLHNRVFHRAEMSRKREKRIRKKITVYNIGDKVLLRNRQLPSSLEGIAKNCCYFTKGHMLLRRITKTTLMNLPQ